MARVVESLVLIVEDDAVVALDLQDAAIDAGYDAILAASATEARDLVSLADPAVAVVDMRLRDGMTGPGLVHDLSGRGVPVIVVSAESADEVMVGLPAFDCVRKPAAPEKVLDLIQAAVGSRRPRS